MSSDLKLYAVARPYFTADSWVTYGPFENRDVLDEWFDKAPLVEMRWFNSSAEKEVDAVLPEEAMNAREESSEEDAV